MAGLPTDGKKPQSYQETINQLYELIRTQPDKALVRIEGQKSGEIGKVGMIYTPETLHNPEKLYGILIRKNNEKTIEAAIEKQESLFRGSKILLPIVFQDQDQNYKFYSLQELAGYGAKHIMPLPPQLARTCLGSPAAGESPEPSTDPSAPS